MKRRELFRSAAAFGLMEALPFVSNASSLNEQSTKSLTPSANGMPIAFVISEGAVVIDFCGPWEVFERVNVPGQMGSPFHLYTVAETLNPVTLSGGMKVIPNHTFGNAPAPKVVVIPAQMGQSETMLNWIRASAKSADVIMSVCTGAFVLASTGMLKGKAATTHHAAYLDLAVEHPDVQVKRGMRFVDNGNLATAGGLSSGIDLALHVVERYYGRDIAAKTAYMLEYQGQGWKDPNANSEYAKTPASTEKHPLCAICGMDIDPKAGLKSVYQGRTYYFCVRQHQELFDRDPQKVIKMAEQSALR